MHAEYLRKHFLDNDLAEGRYRVNGKPVVLTDNRVSVFCVATTRDHVAPWQSVFKIHLLTDTEVTFVLTSGGHNAGIVSEPARTDRTYQIGTASSADHHYADPESWKAMTAKHPGSWWPAWCTWLSERSGELAAPPSMGSVALGRALCDAPGTYVHGQ